MVQYTALSSVFIFNLRSTATYLVSTQDAFTVYVKSYCVKKAEGVLTSTGILHNQIQCLLCLDHLK